MKRNLWGAGLLAAAWALAAGCGERPGPAQTNAVPQTAADPSPTLVCFGAEHAEEAEAAMRFVTERTGLSWRKASLEENAPASLEAAVKQARDKGRPGALGLVVLVAKPAAPEAPATQTLDGATVIDWTALQAGAVRPDLAPRRLERVLMRHVAAAAGLTPCPNPQCVLAAYQEPAELDAMSRDLCPPCMQKLQTAAEAQGLPVSSLYGAPAPSAPPVP